MEESENKPHVNRVHLNAGLEREEIMKRWDSWRAYIAEGGTASWPRDDFESILDAYDENKAAGAPSVLIGEREVLKAELADRQIEWDKILVEKNIKLSARAFKAEAEFQTILDHCRTLEAELAAIKAQEC